MNILLLGLIFFSVSSYAGNCSEYKNDCEFYACITEEKHCAPRNYPLKFGKKYCLRYETRINFFSDQGKTWIEDVRKCLIHEMDIMDENLTCRQLKRKAFKTHVPCYVSSGICSLPLRDKKAILTTIWPSLKNARILANGLQVLKQCY